METMSTTRTVGTENGEDKLSIKALARQRSNSRAHLAYLFLAPALLLVILVTLIPVAYALGLSMLKTSFLNVVGFAGLANYAQFLGESLGRQNVRASVVWVLGSLVLSVPIGLGLAILLNRDFPFRTVFRTILVLPWVITLVATALLWGWILNPQYGPIDFVLRQLTGTTVNFLGDPTWAMVSMIVANVWQSYPYAMILALAGLQTIPGDLLEAASIDGATTWRQFLSIKLPLLRNHLLVATILLGINYFNQVTMPLILTGGGPVNATYVMGVRVFNEAFSYYHMGFASAIAVYMLLFNLIFTLIYLRVLRGESMY